MAQMIVVKLDDAKNPCGDSTVVLIPKNFEEAKRLIWSGSHGARIPDLLLCTTPEPVQVGQRMKHKPY